MKFMKLILLAGLMLSLGACAEVKMAKENTMGAPKKDAGLVYFYREKHFVGGATAYNVWENEKAPHRLGSLGNGTYFYTYLKPGKYTFYVNGENRGASNLNIKAGQTYYLQNRIDPGVWAARPKLTEVTESEAMKELTGGELKMSISAADDPNPPKDPPPEMEKDTASAPQKPASK